MSTDLKHIYRDLARAVDRLTFAPPVTHVYNPLVYAREPAEQYFALAPERGCEALFLGMNPGPWGMAQTGVPFGTVSLVRDWMGIVGPVGKPGLEHPKRPIDGFGTKREEVSGQRFWGWARERFSTPARFFQRFYVANYCPLVFMEASGRNRTPDKLPAVEREPLFLSCDRALLRVVDLLRPRWVVGVGKFAEQRARSVLKKESCRVEGILHPSPASPVSNRGWAAQAEKQLEALGIL